MPQANTAGEAWHRNPWVWLIIAIPTLTVVGCMLTIFLAITNPEALVYENASDDASTTRTFDVNGND